MRRPELGWSALEALHGRGGAPPIRGRGRGTVVESVRVDLDVDEGKVVGPKHAEEAVDERAVERVAVELEDLKRARGGARGEVHEQRLRSGGREAQYGEAELAQVRGAEVEKERGEEGVPQLSVPREVYDADVGLVECCCEPHDDPWVRLGFGIRQCPWRVPL